MKSVRIHNASDYEWPAFQFKVVATFLLQDTKFMSKIAHGLHGFTVEMLATGILRKFVLLNGPWDEIMLLFRHSVDRLALVTSGCWCRVPLHDALTQWGAFYDGICATQRDKS